MKNITILFIVYILISFKAYPQTVLIDNGFSLKLDNNDIVFSKKKNSNSTSIDFYKFTDPSKAGNLKLPTKIIYVAIPHSSRPQIKYNSISHKSFNKTIPTIQPEIILANDSTYSYKSVNIPKLQNENILNAEIIDYVWIRDFYCAVVQINSYKYAAETNSIEFDEQYELTFSFQTNYSIRPHSPIVNKSVERNDFTTVIYNSDIAEQFRSTSHKFDSDSSDSWINFQSDYLKLSIYKDGIYRLNKSFFEDKGINATNIDPRTFQLFNYGKEVPIFVNGESDLKFDEGDFIEFHGSKNYSKTSNRLINGANSSYNEFMNRYSDTSFFFITWGADLGKRISSHNTITSGAQDTIQYFKELLHVEKNTWFQNFDDNDIAKQTPNWNNNKTWYWDWLGSWNTPRTFTFNTDDLFKNRDASIYFKLTSGGSNIYTAAHIVKLSVNDIKVDSLVVNRFDQVLLKGSINSNNLNEGSNSIKLDLTDNGTNPNFLAYDWFEIEYPKNLSFLNDSANFKIADITTELKKIKISNATKENYIIYKTFPFSKRISDYEIFDGNLFFNDTVSTGDKYCVVSSDKLLLPAKSLIKNFSELSDKSNSTEYLAITHPKFLAGAQDYTNYISENFNVSTKTVLVTDIFDQYGYGYPTPESIKEFLINAYNNWAEPKFSYLTLIGDAAYDYKNYEKQNGGVSLSTNYVPSYGNPTGDYWYGIWDDSNFSIPQMKIGRLPIHNITDLEFYKSKIKNNIEQPYDSWNKKYLFFSGGETEADINQLKAANESVISRSVNSSPLFGNYWHFYKTVNPQSDFGPYTPEVFQNAINSGGVFISYLGHSGAALWDNSINSVLQLENKVNRNPLITDFGCSTNKFAEPDIVCFGEKALFENGGQSLGYIGNSSLGFFTNALNAPTLFYKNLILDSLHEVGSAHLKSKIDLISKYGYTGFSKVFLSTNILLGDPIVRIKIPSKPNLNISASDILLNSELNESLDSSLVKIIINNFGTVNAEKLKIKIEENYFGKIINSKELDIPFVQHTDTLNYYIMTKNNPGVHSISVFVDPKNEVDEIYENDNVANLNINVYSQGLRDMSASIYENSKVSFLNLINPSIYPNYNFNIEVQISESENFNNITSIIKPSDTLLTKLELNLEKNRRYWYRYKLEESSDFSIEKSFYLGGEEKYLINDQYSFDKQYIDALDYSNHLALSNDSITISVLSAGGNSGANCIIAKDGQNLLSNSISAGIGIVVIDPITIEVDTSIWFTWSNQHTSVQNLADFINTIENGKIVVMGVADDASNDLSTNLKNAIKTLGSTKIDSLVFQGSWAIISHKGAAPGSVIEKVLNPPDGQVFLDSVFIKNNVSGTLKTNLIGPSTNWKNLSVFDSFPNNSSITYRPILISQSDNSEDTLAALNLVNGEAALKNINAAKYPYIKILAEFEAGDNHTSPALNSLGVDYTSVPELAINYQVVSIEQDTVQQGEDAILSFYIYNVGESRADSFKVQVEVIKSDNSREQIFEQIVDSLGAEKRKEFKVAYNTLNISGERTFSISIDSDNKILELFEDNNFYKVPFYVNEDITNPTVAITFDGNDIIEGEYISSTPKIKIEMSEPSFVPITDTSSISILLNNEKVYYKGNEEILTINYSSSNPKVVVDYTPQLEDGEYELRVFGKDASGNVADSLGLSKSFIVASDAKIMDVYNYPNPMTDETYFTFKLTQIPDEVKIRIFTIAGRLIRKIIINSSELNYDLNKIYWDGLDADGDKIGNGIYIYRVIMDVDGKKQVETSKLAVVK